MHLHHNQFTNALRIRPEGINLILMLGNSFFRLVTLKIPGIAAGNTGQQFDFTDQADIRYARVLHLEAFFQNDLAFSFPEPLPVIADVLANKCALVLETNDPDDLTGEKTNAPGRFTSTTQTQKWLPLTAIHRVQSQGGILSAPFVRQLLSYRNLYITWQKSFLNVAPGGLGNTVDIALCLGVWYTFIDIHGKAIQRI